MTVEKITQYEGMIDWRLPSEKPSKGNRVIYETLEGDTFTETLKDDIADWGETVIKWAYLDKMEGSHETR